MVLKILNMSAENLSEKLFKPKFKYPETSLISNSGCPLPKLEQKKGGLGFLKDWYRPVHRFWWTLGGGNILDIDECLSAIASSTQERSRSQCFDTVIEYGGGNWIFEFSKLAQERAMSGRAYKEAGDLEQASHEFRMASRYFSIASFPFLKGDVLAADALLLGRRTYRDMCECESNIVKLEEFKIQSAGTEVTGFLHLPNTSETHSCVILLCSYENSATDFYRFYKDKLQPYNIALLVLEMPGIGLSEKLTLQYSKLNLIDDAIEALQKHPNINSQSIGLLGIELGAYGCIRTAIMSPKKIKAITLIEPAVHSFFTDKNILESMPLAERSLYANRMNLDAAQWNLVIPQLKPFSLKEQGLLGRSGNNKVPCFVANFNVWSTKEDLKLLEGNFKDFETLIFKGDSYSGFMNSAVSRSCEFLREHML